MRGETMAERMRGDIFADPRFKGGVLDNMPESTGAIAVSTQPFKKPCLRLVNPEVFLERFEGSPREHGVTVLFALAVLDTDFHPVAFYIDWP